MLEIISTSLLDNSYIEIQFREILHCDVILAAFFFPPFQTKQLLTTTKKSKV